MAAFGETALTCCALAFVAARKHFLGSCNYFANYQAGSLAIDFDKAFDARVLLRDLLPPSRGPRDVNGH